MLKGLQECENTSRLLNIPFHIVYGNTTDTIPKFATEHKAVCVVTDFMPLKHSIKSVEKVAESFSSGESGGSGIGLVQVDAHNIVPVWIASPKLEYGARTIRKKINDKLPVVSVCVYICMYVCVCSVDCVVILYLYSSSSSSSLLLLLLLSL